MVHWSTRTRQVISSGLQEVSGNMRSDLKLAGPLSILMALHHIRLDHTNPSAILNGQTMPRLEFRQALFRTPAPGWQKRLYSAALVVTTVAHGLDARRLAVDHQAMRSVCCTTQHGRNPCSWTSGMARAIAGRHRLNRGSAEVRLRDLRLGPEKWVEVAFLG